MEFQTGDILLNKYRIEAFLGEGGFGEVYQAVHLQLGARRALKVLRREGVSAEAYQRAENRFRLEAAVGAQLDDANVVRVYDFEQDQQTLVLVMEYCPGGSLAQRLKKAGAAKQPLALNEIVKIAQEIALGLAALHALPVIHRDLKPANILFDAQGRAKISDLGLAQIGDEFGARSGVSQDALHPGTPGYMSPEQARRAGYLRPAADIYALGCILFEMLTLQRWQGPHGGGQVRAWRADTPAWLDALLLRMLADDPAKRPQDSRQVFEMLRRRRASLPAQILAHLAQRAARWRGWIVALLLIASLTLLASGGWLWFYQPAQMSGDFRVAVAGFSVSGEAASASAGSEVGEIVFQTMEKNFSNLPSVSAPTVWGPDRVGTIDGESASERAEAAEKLAHKLGADMLIYGGVDASQPTWQVTLEFYVSAEAVSAYEIAGATALGEPLAILGENSAWRLDFSAQIAPRLEVLARVTLGLLYTSLNRHEQALVEYQAAKATAGWKDNQGKALVYLLIGNTYLKLEQFEAAQAGYQRSLELDPQYARAYVGLGSVYYQRALQRYLENNLPADIDLAWLEQSQAAYQQALAAANQPPHADIPAKVHMGLGQVYLMRAYSQAYPEQPNVYTAAQAEFQSVLEAYGDGANPRLRELAGEAHGQLGVIALLEGDLEQASVEYALASALLQDINPERYTKYATKAANYRQTLQPESAATPAP